jgi:hypothetical protein
LVSGELGAVMRQFRTSAPCRIRTFAIAALLTDSAISRQIGRLAHVPLNRQFSRWYGGGKFLSFAEVVDRLRAKAIQMEGEGGDSPRAVIAVLDVSDIN